MEINCERYFSEISFMLRMFLQYCLVYRVNLVNRYLEDGRFEEMGCGIRSVFWGFGYIFYCFIYVK